MRFIVFIDLFSTIVQPTGVIYIAYLIYSLLTDNEVFPLISLIILISICLSHLILDGLQVVLFIFKQEWSQIGWMFVYLMVFVSYLGHACF
jgi:chitin synthase